MIRIPLSQSGPTADFTKAVEYHRAALEKHIMGKGANPGEAGRPPPISPEIISAVIGRQPQDGPVATRGPDKFVILPYEIYDDRPVSPELQLLRDSIKHPIGD